MQFAHSLQLPVPAVHEISESGKQTSILMDFVDGECLEEVWPTMNIEEKQSVAEQVRDIITVMRKATPNQTSIGAFDGPARDCRQFLDYQGGPFESISTFNEFVLDFLDGTPPYIRQSITEAVNDANGSRNVLSHCDLTPRNIIVQDGRIKALLDWEYAGWYPEYWEFVKFFDRPTGCKDWKSFAGTMFEVPYAQELLVFQALARWQRP